VLSDIPLRGKTEIFFLRVASKRKCAPINCFHFTPSLRSLSLWCMRGFRRFVPQCLITPPTFRRGSKGCLVDLLLTVAKLPPTLEAYGIKSRAHPNKTLFHYAPFLMREFVALSCGFLPSPSFKRNVARPQGFIKQGKRLRGSASLDICDVKGRASRSAFPLFCGLPQKRGRKKIGASISPILFAKTELSYNSYYKTLPLPRPFARPAPTSSLNLFF